MSFVRTFAFVVVGQDGLVRHSVTAEERIVVDPPAQRPRQRSILSGQREGLLGGNSPASAGPLGGTGSRGRVRTPLLRGLRTAR